MPAQSADTSIKPAQPAAYYIAQAFDAFALLQGTRCSVGQYETLLGALPNASDETDNERPHVQLFTRLRDESAGISKLLREALGELFTTFGDVTEEAAEYPTPFRDWFTGEFIAWKAAQA